MLIAAIQGHPSGLDAARVKKRRSQLRFCDDRPAWRDHDCPPAVHRVSSPVGFSAPRKGPHMTRAHFDRMGTRRTSNALFVGTLAMSVMSFSIMAASSGCGGGGGTS